MKCFKPVLLMLTLASIVFISCEQGAQKKAADTPNNKARTSATIAYNEKFLIESDTAQKWIMAFREETYPKAKNLSKAIWLDKRTILDLAKTLENDESLDGWQTYLFQYDQFKVPSQETENQVSLVFFPTTPYLKDGKPVTIASPRPDENGKYVQIPIHQTQWNYIKLDPESKIGYGLNHSQLCPIACPEDGLKN